MYNVIIHESEKATQATKVNRFIFRTMHASNELAHPHTASPIQVFVFGNAEQYWLQVDSTFFALVSLRYWNVLVMGYHKLSASLISYPSPKKMQVREEMVNL